MISPDTLITHLKGYRLRADDWNAVISAIKALLSGSEFAGIQDGDGSHATRPVQAANPNQLWFGCTNTDSDPIPVYSLFAISGNLGTPNTNQQVVYPSQTGSGKAAAPNLLCTNGSNEINGSGTAGGIGYARIVSDWEEVLCKWTGTQPVVGQMCGLEPGTYKVSTDRLGLYCTGSREIGSETYVTVYKVPDPGSVVGKISQTLPRFDVDNQLFGRGKIKVAYRGADASSGDTLDQAHQALSPADGTEWELDVFNFNPVSSYAINRVGHAVHCMGVGLVFFPLPCSFVLEDCNTNTSTRYPNGYASNCSLIDYVDTIISIEGYPDVCWNVRLPNDGDPQDYVDGAVPVNITAQYDDCSDCKSCWKLTECTPGTRILYTNSNFARYKNKVVKIYITEGDTSSEKVCFTVTAYPSCTSEARPRTVIEYYETCTPCAICYTLENCNDSMDTIQLYNDLLRLANERDPALHLISAGDVVGLVFRVKGKCYKVTTYGTCGDDAYYDANIGKMYSGIGLPTPCSKCGCIKFTECPGGADTTFNASSVTLDGVNIDLLEENDAGEQIYADHVFRRTSDGLCFTWEESEDCTMPAPVAGVFQEEYDDCEKCVVYTLTSWNHEGCGLNLETKTVYTDLIGLYDDEDIVGKTIKDDADVCWKVVDNAGVWAGSVDWNPKADTEPYPDCESCYGQKRYRLTNSGCIHDDCGGSSGTPAADIVTQTDLSEFIGQYKKYQGTCYLINDASGSDSVTVADVGQTDIFPDCADCKAASTTWTQKVITDVRVNDAAMSLQYKATNITVTGKSNCPDAGWTDFGNGSDCGNANSGADAGAALQQRQNNDLSNQPGVVTESYPGQGTWQYSQNPSDGGS